MTEPGARTWHVDPADVDATESLTRRIVDRVAASLRNDAVEVPPLPEEAIRLNELANSSDPDIRAVVRLLEHNATLSGKLLALASSPLYRSVAAVKSLDQAVMRVGINGVRDLAFAVMMGRVFRCGALEPAMRDVNRRSYVLAAATSAVARALGLDRQQAFLCGLLADVGKLLLIAELWRQSKQSPDLLRPEVVQEVSDTMHAELGALVATRWGMSPLVREVVRCHHQPQQAGAYAPMAMAVASADIASALPTEDPGEMAELLQQEQLIFVAGVPLEGVPALAEVVLAARRSADVF